jgi:hypothetical protein
VVECRPPALGPAARIADLAGAWAQKIVVEREHRLGALEPGLHVERLAEREAGCLPSAFRAKRLVLEMPHLRQALLEPEHLTDGGRRGDRPRQNGEASAAALLKRTRLVEQGPLELGPCQNLAEIGRGPGAVGII